MQILLSVAIGGALGALARFYLSEKIDLLTESDFPLGILICNILGSAILGILYALFSKDLFFSENTKIFLQVGVLGSFTTFSVFSLEAYLMLEKGNYSYAALFIITSVFLSIIGLILGINFTKIIF